MSLCCEAKNCTQCSRWGCTNAEYTGTITYFGWLAILCLMHPMIPLAFLVTKTLTCTLPSPKTTRSLSAGLCSSPLSWNVYVYPGLHSSGRRYFQSFFFFFFFPLFFFFLSCWSAESFCLLRSVGLATHEPLLLISVQASGVNQCLPMELFRQREVVEEMLPWEVGESGDKWLAASLEQ